MAISELSEEQQAFIADRARVWEVRRFCQVLPSVAEYERVSNIGSTSKPLKPHGSTLSQAPVEPIWATPEPHWVSVGQDTILFVTNDLIALWQTPRAGMVVERTKDLPFVQGDIAKFRYYAGIPLNPYDGPNIGTVFIFSETPSEAGLSAADRSYMFEVAAHITKHLEQAVEALEGKRVLRFNQGVASLLKMGSSASMDTDPQDEQPRPYAQLDQQHLVSNLYTESTLRVYHLAATLLHDTFEFDGVRIQEADMYGKFIINNPNWNGSKLLAQHLEPTTESPGNPSSALMNKLLEEFPQGVVIHIPGNSGDVVATTSAEDVTSVVDPIICTELPKTFPKARQIIVMPLRDAYHERSIGAVLGFANDQSRVYLSSTDLSSISAFCTTIMTQVRRLEAQAMDKIKSDFLGSVSHEMRTPLHGILSSLELLADTSHDAHQSDLLETARYSGMSLLETIDRILHFSNISSTARIPEEARLDGPKGLASQQSGLIYPQTADTQPKKDASAMVRLCEEIVQRESQRLRLKDAIRPEISGYGQDVLSRQSSPAPSAHAARSKGPAHLPLVLFDTNVAWSCRLTAVASFRAVFTNLLDNALKFGDASGCIRISLDVDETSCVLCVTDTGKGIDSSFLRHSVFDAFSQEDPLVDGTGLGLSIVKRTTTTLGGELVVDSDERRGSIFTATYPSTRLVFDAGQTMKTRSTNLPQLELSLFTPTRWSKQDSLRDRHCVEMLLASITRGLSRWFQVTVTPWQSTSTNKRLLFVLQEDVIDAKQTFGVEFDDAKRVLICPGLRTTVITPEAPSENVATIVGPVTLSSLQNAVACLFSDLVPAPGPLDTDEQSHASDKYSGDSVLARGRVDSRMNGAAPDDKLSEAVSRLDIAETQTESTVEDTTSSEPVSKTDMEHSLDGAMAKTIGEATNSATNEAEQVDSLQEPTPIMPPPMNQRAPKLLLVDDNPVNLKVLSMYAKKCSTLPAKSVDGGRKAIDAFKKAFSKDNDTSQPFDLIFLDLSMPEVSGFEVARQIREAEAASESQTPTYICALTGLVSDKDRNAAYASGVNHYLLKPARSKDLQDVIDMWRNGLTD
ncbi:two-component sensor protein histidine protein kinase [Stemphylium lycopersici]|uniref:histidine kinase n=1 Tax=Stemphylium lycopersici TaxID=183478 RepID=A0A364N704_STELY|nr:two-component sensor protein histidine protein kinase [Stemphylium lycopersici]RAR13040.1 two-component sensor protein histidine protein kinase [Stemphylium lycopersici]